MSGAEPTADPPPPEASSSIPDTPGELVAVVAPDGVTKAAVALAVAAWLLILFPLLSVIAAGVGSVVARIARRRADEQGRSTRTATICLVADLVLVALLLVGSLVYSAGAS